MSNGRVDLSAEMQEKVVFYLGYPAKIIEPNSTHYNGTFHDYLKDLTQFTVDRVGQLITLIEETRTKLDATRDDGHVNRVGEIGLSPDKVTTYISKQYNRYLNELSMTLDIPRRPVMGARVLF